MRKILCILLIVLMAINGWAQRLVISGTVVDGNSREPVSGASVTMDSLSVVTNDDGFFTLKSDHEGKTVVVSHVGYRAQRIKLSENQQEPLRVTLMPATIQLNEVLVMANNPRDLVMAAIKKIPDNYSRQSQLYNCFYREKAMKRQHYISVAEGVIDMFKTGYDHTSLKRDAVTIRKGRRLMSTSRGDTLGVKVLGGPVTPVVLDIVKNTGLLLNVNDLDCYSMKMEVPTTIGDRQQFVVSIEPQQELPYALYYGRLYIDQETLAFTRAELSLDMSNREKATNMMLIKKPKGLRFKPKELSLLVDYRQGIDGVTRISYIRTTFRFNCDWRRRLFATSFAAFCEMVVTSSTDGDMLAIRGRDTFDQRDAFFDHVDYFRDPLFWKDYNIIEPTETLDKAVNKLIKKQ